MLEIKNLKVETKSNKKQIIKKIDFSIEKGEAHVLMGPNGSGKSTLAKAIMSHPKYTIANGDIKLNDEILTNLKPEQKAKKGLFLSMQNPVEVSGVPISKFLHLAKENKKQGELKPKKFCKKLKQEAKEIGFESEFINRPLNFGFSGGEKKKSELLQILALDPDYIIFDEIDSGLDIDALKSVAEIINSFTQKGVLLITHYERILNWLDIDRVYIIKRGKVVKRGAKNLVSRLEEVGYDNI